MRVVDMHCDTLSVLLRREREGQEVSLRQNDCMVSLEKMRRGDYGLQTFAAFIYAPEAENPLEEALSQIDLFERQMEVNVLSGDRGDLGSGAYVRAAFGGRGRGL